MMKTTKKTHTHLRMYKRMGACGWVARNEYNAELTTKIFKKKMKKKQNKLSAEE